MTMATMLVEFAARIQEPYDKIVIHALTLALTKLGNASPTEQRSLGGPAGCHH